MENFSINFDAYNKLALSETNENYDIDGIVSSYDSTNSAASNNLSIFSDIGLDVSSSASTSTASAEELRTELQSVQEEQGFLGKAWNGFKNLTGLGLGSADVEDKIEAYENGEISYDEALESIESYETKQDNMVDLAANVVSGVVTGAVAIGGSLATFGLGTAGSVAAGAALGGVVKAGIKTADRATNEVKGDELDLKQITKDVVTGAVDGAVNVATAGMFEGVTAAGQTVKQAVTKGIVQGAKSGAISGAAAGAASYTVEAAVEEDVDFTISGFATTTIQNAIGGAVMGGVVGGVTGGVQQNSLNKKVIVSHAENPGAAVDNSAQAEDYIVNYNKNNPDEAIPAEKINSTAEDLTVLSKESEGLAVTFDSQLDEATEQINKAFGDKSEIEVITSRAKSQKSTFSKLAKKDINGKLDGLDTESCYDAIGDALGIRIQMKSLDTDETSKIVGEILEKNGITSNADDFAKYLQNPDTDELSDSIKSAFSGVQDEILDTLKTKQTQNVVDQLTQGIKDGSITITEINNYGDDLSSYFTNKQLQEIVDAYDDAVSKGLASNDKAFEIVNNSELMDLSNTAIDDDGAYVIQSKSNENSTIKIKQESGKAATKESGYTSSQMNTKHALSDGTTANGELQIRGTEVNSFADVEHIPYDIRTGKITETDSKYSGIYSIIKKMEDVDYDTYNKYLSDTYKNLRLRELGLLSKDSVLPQLSIEGYSTETLNLINWNGLASISGH